MARRWRSQQVVAEMTEDEGKATSALVAGAPGTTPVWSDAHSRHGGGFDRRVLGGRVGKGGGRWFHGLTLELLAVGVVAGGDRADPDHEDALSRGQDGARED